jgi:hypothetical protein
MLQAEPVRRCNLESCKAACCLHGVWVDQVEAQEILANAKVIVPHLPLEQADPLDWFDGRQEADEYAFSGIVEHTTVILIPKHYGGTACIFLRLDDHKYALQVAAVEEGLHKWRFKPFYCILHPLDLDDQGRITLDEIHLLLDEPGSCLQPAEKPMPLLEVFEEELTYLLKLP